LKKTAGLFDFIARKRAGAAHEPDEIAALVRGYCDGSLSDDDLLPWLRAVMEAGMSLDETTALTDAMARSGEMLDWSDVVGTVVDKHSTGGVGDAVSLIVVPLAAACGVKVAKLSGRALGHTGGTLDKLERIPGLRTDLSVREFKVQVAEVGCAIAGASERLAPADKKMYALRHRTHTVASIPLIAASVLSKKIAGGAPTLVIDVKAGRGAFMPDLVSAQQLAETIAAVGSALGRTMHVFVTDMNAPLASSIGDALELDEALGVLQGREGSRLFDVAIVIAAAMVAARHVGQSDIAVRAEAAVRHALRDGTARVQFEAMVRAQSGALERFDRPKDPALLVPADEAGVVAAIDAKTAAQAVIAAERDEPGTVGVRFLKHLGERVERGQPLLAVYGTRSAATLAGRVRGTLTIAAKAPAPGPLIFARIDRPARA
jgi:pyrimidine-nucleoside phosphorylase